MYRDRVSERVAELHPKPQPDLGAVAATRSLDTAHRIGSDPLEGVMQLIEDELVCCGDRLRRRPYGIDPALLFREGCGIRILQAAKHCILRAGRRVATRAGSYRLKGHRSRALPHEALYFGVWNERASADSG
jgi:hypothetical protein